MSRVLLLAATTGYQIRAFGEAAERLGIDLVYATDRCHVLDDPWQDEAVPVRFHDEEASAEAILEASRTTPIDGVLAVGDRPTVIAAHVLQGLGLPGHPPSAAAAARNKLLTRERLRDYGLPVPGFLAVPLSPTLADVQSLAASVTFPAVVKPLALSASRGVMRVNDPAELTAALGRLRSLLQSPDIRGERTGASDMALIEDFVEGREFAVEGLMEHGRLRVLALFDKPDPLDGPFFEETIYVTPSSAADEIQKGIAAAVADAAEALGLFHGPVHAECRVSRPAGLGSPEVFVLEVAARPIGGLCARALRFSGEDAERVGAGDPSARPHVSLEELLLRHALGQSTSAWAREEQASGVMMIPIPRRGIYRGVSGLDAARAVAHIEDVRLTAKTDQLLVPLPEGASYLGFIFARAATAAEAERALRTAHGRLEFAITPEVRVLQSLHG